MPSVLKKETDMSEELVVRKWTRAEAKELPHEFDRNVLRALVDYRFAAQLRRKGTDNQIGAIQRSVDTSPDMRTLEVLSEDFRILEGKADRAIKGIVEAHAAGRWAVSVPGVAHTFAAVLLAYVDVKIANTAGKLWSFFGVNPTMTWGKGQKRPYCALGKTVTWQIGESFKKLGADHASLYARLYRQRKAQEIERNDAGLFRDQALARLAECVAKKRRISDLQRETWGSGKIQPIGLDYRAGRYAAKMFLSHFHHVLHVIEMGECPPVPYILGPGKHADFIKIPGWAGCEHGLGDPTPEGVMMC